MRTSSTRTQMTMNIIDRSSQASSKSSCSPLLDSFVWPPSDCPLPEHGRFAGEEDVPTIDLSLDHNKVVDGIGRACEHSGFFQVVGHGVDQSVIDQVHHNSRAFFQLPDHVKARAARAGGNSFGFAGKFAGRFTSKCPWKETFSLQFAPKSNIKDFLVKVYEEEESSQHQHLVYSTFCDAMNTLGNKLMHLIAESLGLPHDAFDSYFGSTHFSIFRLNMYPPSEHFSKLLGTGPHTDPCALTILHQDGVGGLQVYTPHDTWLTVRPRSDAFVISIGDTFQALCNHRYKSAKHRAVIHESETRHSLVFFINPDLNTVIKPIPELVTLDHPQKSQQFSWGQLLEFTQKHYRTDAHTLDAFENHLKSKANATS